MVEYSTIEPWQGINENGVTFDQGSLMAHFHELMDKRKARGKRYELVTLLVLVFLAKLSGMDGPSAIADWCEGRTTELVKLLRLGYAKMPSHHTFRRLFATVLEEETFEERMQCYTVQQREGTPETQLRVMDGKKTTRDDPAW